MCGTQDLCVTSCLLSSLRFVSHHEDLSNYEAMARLLPRSSPQQPARTASARSNPHRPTTASSQQLGSTSSMQVTHGTEQDLSILQYLSARGPVHSQQAPDQRQALQWYLQQASGQWSPDDVLRFARRGDFTLISQFLAVPVLRVQAMQVLAAAGRCHSDALLQPPTTLQHIARLLPQCLDTATFSCSTRAGGNTHKSRSTLPELVLHLLLSCVRAGTAGQAAISSSPVLMSALAATIHDASKTVAESGEAGATARHVQPGLAAKINAASASAARGAGQQALVILRLAGACVQRLTQQPLGVAALMECRVLNATCVGFTMISNLVLQGIDSVKEVADKIQQQPQQREEEAVETLLMQASTALAGVMLWCKLYLFLHTFPVDGIQNASPKALSYMNARRIASKLMFQSI